MEKTPGSEREGRAAAPRRPYITPTLTVFGGVADLTGTLDMSGRRDGGPANSKT